jgi:hypothetical protein
MLKPMGSLLRNSYLRDDLASMSEKISTLVHGALLKSGHLLIARKKRRYQSYLRSNPQRLFYPICIKYDSYADSAMRDFTRSNSACSLRNLSISLGLFLSPASSSVPMTNIKITLPANLDHLCPSII